MSALIRASADACSSVREVRWLTRPVNRRIVRSGRQASGELAERRAHLCERLLEIRQVSLVGGLELAPQPPLAQV